MTADLFLGVDGGQSSTEAVVGDSSGRVLGSGTAGPCNHISGPEAIERFETAMTGAVRAACDAAAVSFDETTFHSVCLGLSGGPEDKAEHIRRVLRADRFKITHDAETALWGALDGAPGIVVIAGTGSIAYGRNAEDRSARAGGWGYLFGDEGGAWDVARRAVRATLAMQEGWGEATSLLRVLLEETASNSADEMMHRFYTPAYPRPRVASLARVVDAEAQAGDEVAQRILRLAGEELARYAEAVRSVLFSKTACATVSYIGGVFESALLRERFIEAIEGDGGSVVQAPLRSPAEGALLLAIRG